MKQWTIILGLVSALILAAVQTEAAYVTNLAKGRPVTVTSSHGGASGLVDGQPYSGWWHFTSPYGDGTTPSDASPYFGAVDLAGDGNTVTFNTVRVYMTTNLSPSAWTLQSRDSADDPLEALVDSGWTDTGMGVTSHPGTQSLVHKFGSDQTTRALRFRVTGMTASNDRFYELEVFADDPHALSRNAIDALDPALSREDGVPITSATIDRLRDNDFNKTTPGGVSVVKKDLGDPDARAVMNYDYSFPKAINLEGIRFYYNHGVGNSHEDSQLDLESWDGDSWVAIAGGSQDPSGGLTVFDLTSTTPLVEQLRIKHTAYDTYGAPRSGLYAYEIEIFGTPIPEPATLGLLIMGGIGVLPRRRKR